MVGSRTFRVTVLSLALAASGTFVAYETRAASTGTRILLQLQGN